MPIDELVQGSWYSTSVSDNVARLIQQRASFSKTETLAGSLNIVALELFLIGMMNQRTFNKEEKKSSQVTVLDRFLPPLHSCSFGPLLRCEQEMNVQTWVTGSPTLVVL